MCSVRHHWVQMPLSTRIFTAGFIAFSCEISWQHVQPRPSLHAVNEYKMHPDPKLVFKGVLLSSASSDEWSCCEGAHFEDLPKSRHNCPGQFTLHALNTSSCSTTRTVKLVLMMTRSFVQTRAKEGPGPQLQRPSQKYFPKSLLKMIPTSSGVYTAAFGILGLKYENI